MTTSILKSTLSHSCGVTEEILEVTERPNADEPTAKGQSDRHTRQIAKTTYEAPEALRGLVFPCPFSLSPPHVGTNLTSKFVFEAEKAEHQRFTVKKPMRVSATLSNAINIDRYTYTEEAEAEGVGTIAEGAAAAARRQSNTIAAAIARERHRNSSIQSLGTPPLLSAAARPSLTERLRRDTATAANNGLPPRSSSTGKTAAHSGDSAAIAAAGGSATSIPPMPPPPAGGRRRALDYCSELEKGIVREINRLRKRPRLYLNELIARRHEMIGSTVWTRCSGAVRLVEGPPAVDEAIAYLREFLSGGHRGGANQRSVVDAPLSPRGEGAAAGGGSAGTPEGSNAASHRSGGLSPRAGGNGGASGSVSERSPSAGGVGASVVDDDLAIDDGLFADGDDDLLRDSDDEDSPRGMGVGGAKSTATTAGGHTNESEAASSGGGDGDSSSRQSLGITPSFLNLRRGEAGDESPRAQQHRRLGLLAVSTGLCLAAQDHAYDIGPKGLTTHRGTRAESSVRERVERYGVWLEACYEIMSFGIVDPVDVVCQFLIDDGVPRRFHRQLLLGTKFGDIGIKVAPHAVFGVVCVIVLAGRFMTFGTRELPTPSYFAASSYALIAATRDAPAPAMRRLDEASTTCPHCLSAVAMSNCVYGPGGRGYHKHCLLCEDCHSTLTHAFYCLEEEAEAALKKDENEEGDREDDRRRRSTISDGGHIQWGERGLGASRAEEARDEKNTGAAGACEGGTSTESAPSAKRSRTLCLKCYCTYQSAACHTCGAKLDFAPPLRPSTAHHTIKGRRCCADCFVNEAAMFNAASARQHTKVVQPAHFADTPDT